jgi:hypothetical protein
MPEALPSGDVTRGVTASSVTRLCREALDP